MSGAAETERSGCTVGIAAMLCLLAFSVLGAVFFSGLVRGTVDTEELVREAFHDGRVPFGLESADATDFLGQQGAAVARFVRPEGEDAGAPEDGDLEDAPPPEPIELILVRYHAPENLRKLFVGPERSRRFASRRGTDTDASERLEEWEEEPDFEWRTELMRDKLRWGGWESEFQIHRAFTAEGTWSDQARINVGIGERHLAVLARWPDGVQVVREDLRRVARTIRMELDAEPADAE